MKARSRTDKGISDIADPELDLGDVLGTARNVRRQRVANITELRLRKVEADQTAATLKAEAEVAKLQGATSGGSQVNPAASLVTSLVMQGLQPEQANAFIKALDQDAILKLSMMSGQNTNALLPLILLGSRQGGTTTQDIIAVARTIIDAGKSEGETGGAFTRLVTETIPNMSREIAAAKDAAYASQLALLQKQIEDVKPKDPATYVKEIYDAASALGMRSAGDANSEVAKSRLDFDKWKYEQETNRENTQFIVGTVKDIFEGTAGKVFEKIGGAAADRISKGGGDTPTATNPNAGKPQVLTVQCQSCGTKFNVTSDMRQAKCPSCKKDLTIEFGQPAERPATHSDSSGLLMRPPFAEGGGDFLKPRWQGPPADE